MEPLDISLHNFSCQAKKDFSPLSHQTTYQIIIPTQM